MGNGCVVKKKRIAEIDKGRARPKIEQEVVYGTRNRQVDPQRNHDNLGSDCGKRCTRREGGSQQVVKRPKKSGYSLVGSLLVAMQHVN